VQLDPGFSQLLNLKHNKLLSNFACFGFNFNLRHYTEEAQRVRCSLSIASPLRLWRGSGGAVQGDPGFSQLTPRSRSLPALV